MKFTVKVLICLSFFLLSATAEKSFPQNNLFITKEIKNAYEKQTRSYNGKPGGNYWQNFSSYNINVEIEPASRLLNGSQEITYYNNSPDSLKNIVIKLHQDMYKKGMPRNSQLSYETITEGVTLTSLKVSNNEYNLDTEAKQISYSGTNLIVRLTEPLPPNEKIKIFINWYLTIPKGTNIRMGTYSESTFFVGYWYPKIAVYDDINGWDLFSYNGEHEFYNEYADFNVSIKVPEGFAVWGTGMLQNSEEVLNESYLEKYKKAETGNDIIKIIEEKDYMNGNIFKGENGFSIWKYSASYVPDFAFGLSDHYLWDAGSVEIEEERRVLIQAVYNPDSDFFYEAVEVAKKSIEFFSTIMPAVPYPYPAMTVFNGEDGMEFPMIINDGDLSNRINNIYVTSHEIAHMYFPFYVGTNESKYAWMDEGMAYFLPYDLQLLFEPYDHRIRAAQGYAFFSGKENDFPLMIPSYASRGNGLAFLSYYKPALAFEFLQDALGKELFLKGLQTFIERWNGKHPTPYDFFYTFENVTGKNLNWYWKPWFFENKIPDLAIKEVLTEGNSVIVTIENIGGIPIPVALKIMFEDESEKEVYENTSVWENDNKFFSVKFTTDIPIKTILLGSNIIPDSDMKNNSWKKDY